MSQLDLVLNKILISVNNFFLKKITKNYFKKIYIKKNLKKEDILHKNILFLIDKKKIFSID